MATLSVGTFKLLLFFYRLSPHYLPKLPGIVEIYATLNDAMHFDLLRSVRYGQAGGLPELGTVVDGTKCGNEMVSMALVFKLGGRAKNMRGSE